LKSEPAENLALNRSWPLLRAIRPHQWVKNLLVLVPALAAHRFDPDSLLLALVGALAFALCASAGYLLNDVADRDADSLHPSKCKRPIAAGVLSSRDAIIAAIFLFSTALLLAVTLLPLGFSIALVCYLLLSTGYTVLIRQLPLVDLLALALFYVMRLVAGALAVSVPLSGWLLVFAACLFLGLAMLKRYGELRLAIRLGEPAIIGRSAYKTTHSKPILHVGLAFAGLSLAVFGAYVFSEATAVAYSTPLWLAGCWFSLLAWLALAWFKTHHDTMHDDPVVFAIKDIRSLGLVTMAATCALLAL